MKKIINLLKTTALISLLVFTVSCKSNDSTATSEETKVDETESSLPDEALDTGTTTKKGNEITSLNVGFRPYSELNPLLVRDKYIADALKLVYDDLFIIDDTISLSPNVASDYVIENDSNNVRIEIDTTKKFQNGNKVTASDVKYSLDTLKNAEEDAYYKRCLKGIASYTVISDDVLQLKLLDGYMFDDLDLTFPVISRDDYDFFDTKVPYGTGAYSFTKDYDSKKMVLEANDLNGKKPSIRTVNLIVIIDRETEFYSFQQGTIDLIIAEVDEWAMYRKNKTENISKIQTNQLEFIGFNHSNSLFKNKEVRKAFASAVNYQNIIDTTFLSYADYTATGVNPKSWLYNPNCQDYVFDLEKAKQILTSEGLYQNVSTDTTTSYQKLDTGISLKIIANNANTKRVNVAEDYALTLNNLGFKTEVEILTFEDYKKALANGDFDLAVAGYEVPYNQKYFSVFSKNNYFNINSSKLNTLTKELNNTNGSNVYKNSFFEVQKFLNDEVLIIPLAYKQNSVITHGLLEGAITTVSDPLYNIEDWKMYEAITNE